jgi:peptidoglycan/xylan/chitin deacetylase (PgdA/CDA1 family)
VLKQFLVTSIGALGAWALARRLTRNVPRIFMLHRFSAVPDPRKMDVDDFVQFLDRVTARCELVTVRELVDRLDRPARSDRPLAAITVDDGYADFHAVALPVLAERRLPATLYATAGFIDGRGWQWWDALRFLLDAHPAGPVVLELADRTLACHIGDADSRGAAWSEIADHLVTRNADRAAALEQLADSAGLSLPARPPEAYAPMSWGQLREAEAAGIEIGGHTMTHAYLPSLDEAGLGHELDEAKQLLEAHLAGPLRTFAYPNGMPDDWSPRVEAAVKAAGFEAAVLAHPRPFSANDRYRLGRWSVGGRDAKLGHILNGASDLKLAWQSR